LTHYYTAIINQGNNESEVKKESVHTNLTVSPNTVFKRKLHNYTTFTLTRSIALNRQGAMLSVYNNI